MYHARSLKAVSFSVRFGVFPRLVASFKTVFCICPLWYFSSFGHPIIEDLFLSVPLGVFPHLALRLLKAFCLSVPSGVFHGVFPLLWSPYHRRPFFLSLTLHIDISYFYLPLSVFFLPRVIAVYVPASVCSCFDILPRCCRRQATGRCPRFLTEGQGRWRTFCLSSSCG